MAQLPFDGAISAFYDNDAPQDVRDAIQGAKKRSVITPGYPYAKHMDKEVYETQLSALHIELVKLQAAAREDGQRVAVVFEGRDAAGKGGTIKRFREHLNPRTARVVALSKPTEREQGEWYFQRYIKHLPSAGEMVFFDRSWYNRGVVEKVFGFCTETQRSAFFDQVNKFEKMLVDDGITLVKLWLTVGRAEQLRRFLARESDPLKQWKLSRIDALGLSRWEAYTQAIQETFVASHSDHAPWHVIRTDDKRRARLAAIRTVLGQVDYARRNEHEIDAPDPAISGGPELVTG